MVAHLDDESFGLGALLDRFSACGIEVTVLCVARGEASTLRGCWPGHRDGPAELRAAATMLDVDKVELLAYPDGHLGDTSIDELAEHVRTMIAEVRPSHLLVLDDTGATGHPDHPASHRGSHRSRPRQRAAGPGLGHPHPRRQPAQRPARHDLPRRATTEHLCPVEHVADPPARAIAAHASQSSRNPVLQHRLRLMGDAEPLRLLYTPELESGT